MLENVNLVTTANEVCINKSISSWIKQLAFMHASNHQNIYLSLFSFCCSNLEKTIQSIVIWKKKKVIQNCDEYEELLLPFFILLFILPILSYLFILPYPGKVKAKTHSSQTPIKRFVVVTAQLVCRVRLFCEPIDYSQPGCCVHRIFLGKNTGVCCHFLLQGIYPTQVSCICRWILYHRATKEALIRRLVSAN